jgi:hypothetical protein
MPWKSLVQGFARIFFQMRPRQVHGVLLILDIKGDAAALDDRAPRTG